MLIASFNIQFCRGRDGVFDTARVVDAIKDADVIALQEVEVGWDRSRNRKQPEDIAAAMPGHYWSFHATVDIAKPGPSAGGKVDHHRRQFGNMILSRWPILTVRQHLIPRFTAADQHSIQRGVIEGVIDAPGGRFRFYSTHLCHLSEESRVEQAETIKAIHRNAPFEGAPSFGPHRDPIWNTEPSLPAAPMDAILCGDMNFEPDSPAHMAVCGSRSRFSGRRLIALEGFVDAWEHVGAEGDPGHTIYRDFEKKEGLRIDYVFVSTGMMDRVKRMWVGRDCIASDHQPVYAELADA